jgi:hypothetical protein
MYDVRCTMYATLISQDTFDLNTVVHHTSYLVHYLIYQNKMLNNHRYHTYPHLFGTMFGDA